MRTLRFWSDRGVDGYRIDVAHRLTKDLVEPLPSKAELEGRPVDGTHPLLDRDDVHDVYAEWRTVFDEYEPPAATLFMLGLPGSAYLYQGEELGQHEVAEISEDQRQDPTFHRKRGVDVGRDGCRVPLPWDTDGPSFGFGTAAPHLPQPAWMADHAVSVEEQDPTPRCGSTAVRSGCAAAWWRGRTCGGSTRRGMTCSGTPATTRGRS